MLGAVMVTESSPVAPDVLTPGALVFLAEFVRAFRGRIESLREGNEPVTNDEPTYPFWRRPRRPENWTCAASPSALAGRRVDLVGAVDTRSIVAAFSSTATAFVADLQDATLPRWRTILEAHELLRSVIGRTRWEGTRSRIAGPPILLRPRSLDATEEHIFIDGSPAPAVLFDVGLHCFHNARALVERDEGVCFSITKMRGAAEAKAWVAVCSWLEAQLGLPENTIKLSVRIDRLRALDELDDILWELRARSIGVVCGRSDYVRDLISSRRPRRDRVTPDRAFLTVDRPPLASVAARIIRVCRQRGAQASGPLVNAVAPSVHRGSTRSVYARVYTIATRHARVGFDGTCVADPDLVGVARAALAAATGAEAPRSVAEPRGAPPPTEAGVRENIRIALVHLEGVLDGQPRVRRDAFVEDLATARAARAQLWEWVKSRIQLGRDRVLDRRELLRLLDEESRDLGSPPRARALLEHICLAETSDLLAEREGHLRRALVLPRAV